MMTKKELIVDLNRRIKQLKEESKTNVFLLERNKLLIPAFEEALEKLKQK